ncbi:hypothetical protein Aduo_006299 [Ancylostoma duodenale]
MSITMERRRTRRCSLPVTPAAFTPVASAGPLARPVHVIWRSTSWRRTSCIDEQLLTPGVAMGKQMRRRSPSRTKRVGSNFGHFSPPASSGSASFTFDEELPNRPRSMTSSYTVSEKKEFSWGSLPSYLKSEKCGNASFWVKII